VSYELQGFGDDQETAAFNVQHQTRAFIPWFTTYAVPGGPGNCMDSNGAPQDCSINRTASLETLSSGAPRAAAVVFAFAATFLVLSMLGKRTQDSMARSTPVRLLTAPVDALQLAGRPEYPQLTANRRRRRHKARRRARRSRR
jgi:hypothetical protein